MLCASFEHLCLSLQLPLHRHQYLWHAAWQMAGSPLLNFFAAKTFWYKTDRTREVLMGTCFVLASRFSSGIVVLLPSIIMLCALTNDGITFSQFSPSQGFHLHNRSHIWDSYTYVLRFSSSRWRGNCRFTAIYNYGMRLDKWRNQFFSIFLQPGLPFTKPTARLRFSCVLASF